MRFNGYALPALFLLAAAPAGLSAQCTTSNATSCVCPGGGNTCDLKPDATISWYGLLNYLSGPTEDPGRIYVSGSTPNIGHGPMEIRGVDMSGNRRFVCGVDTFVVYDPTAAIDFTCPNGGTAKQLTTQRIFHKNGNLMSSTEVVMDQGMTYHPTHGHTHFDQWGIYSLRLPEAGVTDPRQWPIINQGYKLGFCLMDYNNCSDAAVDHHCKDDNTIYNAGNDMEGIADFPNLGLGGPYGCSMIRQGISSGYTDIYSEYLDGMWIDIPANTCDGDYWIVYEVDPLNVVVEEDEDNNWTAVPITLNDQGSSGTPQANIHCDVQAFVCPGDQVLLRANAGLSYQWSTGATSNSIMAGPGSYTVTVETYCGTATSAPFVVSALSQPSTPSASGVTICEGESATLTSTGASPVWYDGLGNVVATGNTFNTPALYATTDYWVADVNEQPGTLINGGKPDNSGSGGYHAGGQYLKFDALAAFRLNSVTLYAGSAAWRTIELVDGIGVMRATRSAYLPAGQSVMQLDFDILPGSNYSLTVSGTTDLWRSTSGVSYPYAIGSVASITGSSSGSTSYYYFYDWEVEVGGGSCASTSVPVTVEVEVCTGMEEALALRGFEVWPNPSEGDLQLTIHLLSAEQLDLSLTDVLGRAVQAERLAAPAGELRHGMDLSTLPSGAYLLTLRVQGRSFTRKVLLDR